jgi:hypothetical protein
MYTRSALAARALGVPLVVKLAGDPVYERSLERAAADE